MLQYFIKFPAVINAFIIKITLNLSTYLQFCPNICSQLLEGFPLQGMWLTFPSEPGFDLGR